MIINKIKEAGLTGRGGAAFPTATKWEFVKNAPSKRKFVVCNCSEGEPDVKKDGWLLEKHPEKVLEGMHIAIEYLGAEKGILYLNPSYYKKIGKKLKKIAWDYGVELFDKPHSAGYVGGEETSAINTIEGKRTEPRLRPPFPTTNGLWDSPTLVNNVETFYHVSLINSDNYKNTRLYTVAGDCMFDGVYEFPEKTSVKKVLEKTNNLPGFDFFVQVGGGASGVVLNSSQLNRRAEGAASITIYSISKHDPIEVMKKWVTFFMNESCGKCTPCREGVYRLYEILNKPDPNWNMFAQILEALQESAFCGLGCAVSTPLKSFVMNVLPRYPEASFIKLPTGTKQLICDCFK